MTALWFVLEHIMKTHLFKYIENFTSKNWNFSDKKLWYFSWVNIDYGYSLELPQEGGSNKCQQSMFNAESRKIMHTPVNPSFTIYSGSSCLTFLDKLISRSVAASQMIWLRNSKLSCFRFHNNRISDVCLGINISSRALYVTLYCGT